ncbi:MAG: bifunctional (p)ppGpp synthetase/guanosine-3',5'-bis(diphosphate) 3'-pyrophosphohydrolase [Bacteroidales bacterium]|nr:bifunctional (p)ppGpp synthetase/guanosine-3',5'-bis(diphosphate) 3'-pyrophosphohydrolase [Bacteroidales bacterium]MBQ5538971.1 bifunctional (p)ppGpp synthetase/guanosine-3',5'-bis(diphosphate) 3'-pyrophosphohydrolase [Bacteroidales bacterium]
MAKELTKAEEILHRKPYTEEDTDRMFEQLMAGSIYFKTDADKAVVRKAYNLARDAYKGQKRRTGDSFIYHLFDVMSIVIQDIGLGKTGAVCALLHEITFQTGYSKDDIINIFDEKVALIVESLAKIKGTSEYFKDSEPEVYKKIILGITDDIRIILVKLADRLANLRTLEVREKEDQFKVAYETRQIYVPLAHRLGLSKIKTELEVLVFKFLEPEAYKKINSLMQLSENESIRYINQFSLPIIAKLVQNGIKFDIKGRPKSIYSIYQKMQKKHVGFEEVYDKFALRIIYTPTDEAHEKEECMKIVKLISKDYYVHPERTRDWVNSPKENGYEAYHITVYDSKTNRWVEIQIRSERMNEIAEYGFAAHWKYKGIKDKKAEFDSKLKQLKEKLESPNTRNFDFLEDFKLLLSDEISVYSPEGNITALPSGATVLDYAYISNPEVAKSCIGAKVNHKMMPISTRLHNGDLVEPVTSNYTEPKPEWLNIVVTPKAYNILKEQLHDFIKEEIAEGQNILHNLFSKYKVVDEQDLTNALMSEFGCINKTDLYHKIFTTEIASQNLESFIKKSVGNTLVRFWKLQFGGDKNQNSKGINNLLSDSRDINYQLAECCNTLPGDEAIGVLSEDKKCIYVHKKNCLYAQMKVKEDPLRLIPVSWKESQEASGIAKINLEGVDRKGIALKIITVISQELDLNLKMFRIETDDCSFSGQLEIYVRNQEHLEKVVNKLSDIEGILNIMVEGEEIY